MQYLDEKRESINRPPTLYQQFEQLAHFGLFSTK